MKIDKSRYAAFSIIQKCLNESAFSNLALKSSLNEYKLENVQSRFVTTLVYGVIERKLTLEYNLNLYLSKPFNKLKSDVKSILLLGAYQILYMNKVPNSAAVNESVKLAKFGKCSYASGLINAVLRKVSANGLCLPQNDESSDYYSVKYSVNKDIVELIISQYGIEKAKAFFEYSFQNSKVSIRVNSTKTNAKDLISVLKTEGIEAESGSFENSLLLNLNGCNISNLNSFQSGFFHVQDESSQLCALAVGAKRGDVVLDMCASPGGKSFLMAEMMQNEGRLISFDLHPHRVKLIADGAKRLNLSIIEAKQNDAMLYDPLIPMADKILCDAPCSGLGTIGKKPDIRYKTKDELESVNALQLDILQTSSTYLKPGGRLIYSTCTINKNENERVVEEFLCENPDFILDDVFENQHGCVTFLPPQSKGDGFFIASIKRKTNE